MLVLHDAFVFSPIRAQIDRRLALSSEVERHPSVDVRRAFGLEDPYFVPQIAFELYRNYWWSIPEKEQPLFHSAKLFAVPMWALQLKFWYRQSELETFRIRTGCYDDYYKLGGCDEVSRRLFGKSLNDISVQQLACIRAFYRSRSQHVCAELAALLRNRRK